MRKGNYYLKRDNLSGEILYLEYEKIEGYDITPKTCIEDAIRVNKIVFVNPSLSEKLIRKKVDIKIRGLLKKLDEFEENPSGADEGSIQNCLMDAERLKVMLLNEYKKYLGNTFGSFSLKKIQIIINQLRIKLYDKSTQRRIYENMTMGFNPYFENIQNNGLNYEILNSLLSPKEEKKEPIIETPKMEESVIEESKKPTRKSGIKSSMEMNMESGLFYLDNEEVSRGRGR